MNKTTNIEKKVTDALDSLNDIKRASANPFLYTRVKAAISENSEPEAWYGFVKKPVFALATVVLVLVINAAAIIKSSDNSTVTVQEDEQQLVKEYSYAVSTADRFYSINEEQP